MNTRTRKTKGKQFQNTIRDLLLESFPQLNLDDIKSTTMGDHGEDLQLSEKARKLLPFSTECKRQETLSYWQWMEQCEKEAIKHNTMPLLIFKRNKSDIYCSLKFNDLLKLLVKMNNNSSVKDKLKELNIFTEEFINKTF